MNDALTNRKRARDPPPDWVITFDDCGSLRCIVESAAAVMQRVIFKVKRLQGGRYVLIVNGADMGFTCCVSARLQLDKVHFASPDCETSEFTFCVECKQMLYSIDNPSCSHGTLIMEGHTNKAQIRLKMLDPDMHSHEEESDLNTFVDGEFEPLRDLDFSMMLEMDLTKLREMVKKARKAHAELMRIQVFTKKSGAKEVSLVVFSVRGDTTHTQRFCHETTKSEDGSLIVRAAPDGKETLFDFDDDEPTFDGTFPIEKIDAFVKNLPVRMLVAKIHNNMPLMLTHKLGPAEGDESYVRFLVAPKNDDD